MKNAILAMVVFCGVGCQTPQNTGGPPIQFGGIDGTCNAVLFFTVQGVPVRVEANGTGGKDSPLIGEIRADAGPAFITCKGEKDKAPACSYGTLWAPQAPGVAPDAGPFPGGD